MAPSNGRLAVEIGSVGGQAQERGLERRRVRARPASRRVPANRTVPACTTTTWSTVCATSASTWLENEHRAALGGQVAQQPAQPGHAGRVETVGRLVEDQHLRVAEQRRGQPEALAHAERVAADPAVRVGGQADLVEDLVDPRGREPGEPRGDPQVVAARAAGVEAGRLQHRADDPAGLAQVGVAAPPISASPAVGRTSPSSIRSVVVLPAPFGPRNPVTPGRRGEVGSRTAVTAPNRFVRPRDGDVGHRSFPLVSDRGPHCRRRRPRASSPCGAHLRRTAAAVSADCAAGTTRPALRCSYGG